jgi:Zn-dependent protease
VSDAQIATRMSQATRPHRWSFPVGRVSGIELRVHVSFLILVALFAAAAPEPGFASAAGNVLWLVAIFACVVVHELAHCFVARSRGATVQEILLFPLGGVSRLANIPESPRDEFAIAIVGPLTSIGLGVISASLCLALGQSLLPLDLLTSTWLARLAWLNLILGVFNLVPAFPLDGGRVLRSLLERSRDLETATRIATRVGHGFAAAMIVTGFFFDIWLVLIGAFVYLGASAEEAATIVHVRLRGHRVREAMQPIQEDEPAMLEFVVDADALLDDDLLRLLEAAPGHQLAVQTDGRTVGVLRLEDVGRFVARATSAPAA